MFMVFAGMLFVMVRRLVDFHARNLKGESTQNNDGFEVGGGFPNTRLSRNDNLQCGMSSVLRVARC